MKQFDVITVGDALIDEFLTIHDAARYSYVDDEKRRICFDSGAKILVDDAHFLLGGNACNTAVGFARLGLHTALAAEIGDDEFSEKIIKGLTKDKVDQSLVKKHIGAPTTFSICLTFMQERTLFARHVVRQHDMTFDDVSAKLVYLTSMGKEWKHVYQRVIAFVQRTKALLAFNPGSNQLQEGRESFRDVLAITDILIVNKEEAEEIVYGAPQHTENPATTPETLMQELQKLGPKKICITDGTHGSFALDEEEKFYTQGLLPGNLVEKTGAGDAFSTGLLAGILAGKELQEAMIWGTAESASVIEHIGSEAGLLTNEALHARIEKSK